MILVTGATGNVGGELLRQLLDTEHNIRALIHEHALDKINNGQVERVKGDLNQPETLTDVVQGVDSMYLIMPGHGPEGPEQITRVIDAAEQAGIRHVVFQSSIGASLAPAPQIGQWHREAERVIEDSSLQWTFLRPGSFMSNALQWADTVKSEGVAYSPTGEGKQAPIDPFDIAAVARTALTTDDHKGKTYVLTGPELLSAKEQVEILSAVLGQSIRYVDVSVDTQAEKMRDAGMPPFMVDAVSEVMRRMRAGKIDIRTSTVKQVTGHEPKNFEAWCRKHKEAFK